MQVDTSPTIQLGYVAASMLTSTVRIRRRQLAQYTSVALRSVRSPKNYAVNGLPLHVNQLPLHCPCPTNSRGVRVNLAAKKTPLNYVFTKIRGGKPKLQSQNTIKTASVKLKQIARICPYSQKLACGRAWLPVVQSLRQKPRKPTPKAA